MRREIFEQAGIHAFCVCVFRYKPAICNGKIELNKYLVPPVIGVAIFSHNILLKSGARFKGKVQKRKRWKIVKWKKFFKGVFYCVQSICEYINVEKGKIVRKIMMQWAYLCALLMLL